MPRHTSDDADLGGARFRIRKQLGAGASGAVFEAIDRDRDAVVAIKPLRRLGSAALYRFKRAFRTLAALSHPNVVQLYELVEVDRDFVLAMEFVDGVPLAHWLRPGAGALAVERVRSAVGQLVVGVAALHRAGTAHGDISPTSILVERDTGRVVVLGHGLGDTSEAPRRTDTADRPAPDSRAYAAPERGRGPGSEASDWYSVGVVLYEALTGQLPNSSALPDGSARALAAVPSPPSRIVPDVPDDLDHLCVRLLAPSPADRPSGAALLDRLGLDAPAVQLPRDAPFVGRDDELDQLRAAFLQSADGAVVATIRGRGGAGKTALVEAFLDEIGIRSDALVLGGRCYQHGAVPYNAVASIVTALSRELAQLGDDDAHAVMPRDILALARVFPVLRQVEVVAMPRTPLFEPPDPHESRRRAFAALRELVGALARTRRIVIAIDDAHWGDLDSACLIAELVRGSRAPCVLVIASYRDDRAEPSAFLRAFLATAMDRRDLALDGLRARDARAMVDHMLGVGHSGERGGALVATARGNPRLLVELAHRDASEAEHPEAPAQADLAGLLQQRIDALSTAARRLLTVLAVAGRPISSTISARAADLGANRDAAVAELRAARLVRGGAGRGDAAEVAHAQVRDLAVALLDDRRLRDAHSCLAHALEPTARDDRGALAHHHWRAGNADRASDHAVAAARTAADALAFDRAASLYQFALDARPADRRASSQLRERLASSLANAGRGAEAARAYLSAVDGAYVGEAIEYRRLAAEQLMRAGYVDEGMDALRGVLDALGLALPTSRRRAVISLAWSRARIRLRGLDFVERDPTQIASEPLSRIDTLWSVAAALGMVNAIAGVDFQARNVLLALTTGDRMRVARALSMEGIYVGLAGHKTRRRSGNLMNRALELVEGGDDPRTEAIVLGSAAMRHYHLGEFESAHDRAVRAAKLLRAQCTGVVWELDSSELIIAWSLYYKGQLGELAAHVPECVRAARDRGDLFAQTSFSVGLPSAHWLALDDPASARERSEAAIARWSALGFHLQHYWAWISTVQTALYAEDYPRARAALTEAWPRIERAAFLRIQPVAIEGVHARARVELVSHMADAAAKSARRLEREQLVWSHVLAACVRAGVATSHGDDASAAAHLAAAAATAENCQFGLYAHAAKRRRGELLGGDEGTALCAAVDAALGAHGVSAPARLCRMLIPLPRAS